MNSCARYRHYIRKLKEIIPTTRHNEKDQEKVIKIIGCTNQIMIRLEGSKLITQNVHDDTYGVKSVENAFMAEWNVYYIYLQLQIYQKLANLHSSNYDVKIGYLLVL